jgi:hypothetical protein
LWQVVYHGDACTPRMRGHYDSRDGFGSVGVLPFCQNNNNDGTLCSTPCLTFAHGRKAQAEQWTRAPSPGRLELGSKVSRHRFPCQVSGVAVRRSNGWPSTSVPRGKRSLMMSSHAAYIGRSLPAADTCNLYRIEKPISVQNHSTPVYHKNR